MNLSKGTSGLENALNFWYFLFQYIHNGHDTLSDSFTLVARTRTKTSVPAAVMVQVLPVNDQLPILVNNTKLEMWAGATVVITNDILGTIVQHFFIEVIT